MIIKKDYTSKDIRFSLRCNDYQLLSYIDNKNFILFIMLLNPVIMRNRSPPSPFTGRVK
jgi:hypothetical protein